MVDRISKRTVANGVSLHYIVAGEGPVVLGMHGWPQNHREFLPLIGRSIGWHDPAIPEIVPPGEGFSPR